MISFGRQLLAARLGVRLDDDDGDRQDARLVAAARDARRSLDALFAGREPGPRARAVPVDLDADHPAVAGLRFAAPPGVPVRFGAVERWSNAQIGLPDDATPRVFATHGDALAIGSDRGLALWREGFVPFPWPEGSRRSRIEALAHADGVLAVATPEAWFELPPDGRVRSRRLPDDGDGGRDDVRVILGHGDRRWVGWRCRFEGGDGPPDVLALTRGAGVVWAGTREGVLHVIDGGPIRTFGDPKRRPIRHLAFARGALWVAVDGGLHRFDGATWSRTDVEPTALHADDAGRLWLVRDGAVHVIADATPAPVPVPVARPWCVHVHAGRLWIGHPGGVTTVALP